MLTHDDDFDDLDRAIGQDAEEFLESQAPGYMMAVQEAVLHKSPEEIRQYLAKALGPDRQRLVLRCYQYAKYLDRQRLAYGAAVAPAKTERIKP